MSIVTDYSAEYPDESDTVDNLTTKAQAGSLPDIQEDEVLENFECGIGIEGMHDFEENDIRGGVTFSLPIFDFGRGSKINSAKSRAEEYKWNFDSEIRDYLIVRSEVENRLKSISQSINEIRSTVENTRQQKDILINRMSLSEFNGINLSEIILQDVSNTTRLLENEIQLYIDDLTLSHINSSLLNRFKMEL